MGSELSRAPYEKQVFV